ncbi:MAG TPA: glycine dehydrogenase subunit 2 [Rhizobiales bacterium]|nr:glycine dehydrogenase subunit 2 [Hyphomicrobiales bacterium]
MNREGRPTGTGEAEASQGDTFTGNKGLQIEEPLIFERADYGHGGGDLPEPEGLKARLAGLELENAPDLPGLSEPEIMRHYVRLSQKNYSIDGGLYPLGSCTMKHNPRLNEKMARLPGFADIHPLQPLSTVQGALELQHEISAWLCNITGMKAVTLAPRAGAHGELAGMMAIRAALEARGDARSVVLTPESSHGTNPATASLVGYKVRPIPAREDGTVSAEVVRENLGPEVAGIMITNPNTCGLFERDFVEISQAVHEAGGFVYGDGANLNALMGRADVAALGVDAMHINLHKTFSTPHGGGGPGAGPVVFSDDLASFAPLPLLREEGGVFSLIENPDEARDAAPFGRMAAFQGQMGVFVRALAYMLSHGGNGLARSTDDAVLNANYVRACLADVMSLPFGNHPCMHEVLFDDSFLKDTGVTTLDFAKALIDEGFHPMTVYFPLVVHGAMLIEPTESESKAALDQFIDTLRALAKAARSGDARRFTSAPVHAPRRRLDETRAARQPVLVYEESEEG